MIIIIAYLLSCVLASAVLTIYGYGYVSLLTPLIMLAVALIFGECYLAERHRLLGGLLLAATLFGAMFLVGTLAGIGEEQTNMYFWQWVLNRDEDEALVMPYIYALGLASSVFLSATVYYFSVVLYRISFLTLVSLIPCVLYIKVTAELDNIYLVLIAGLNLAIHLAVSYKGNGHIKCVGKSNALIGRLIFIFVVMAICAAIPKHEEAKYYETFEKIFLNGDTASEVEGNLDELTDFSGNADNYENIKNRRMYSLYMGSNMYVKRQVFDEYDSENDRWFSVLDNQGIDENVYSSEDWADNASNLQLSKLQTAIKRACVYNSKLKAMYRLDDLVGDEQIEDSLCKMTVYAENFKAKYYLSCSRMISVKGNEGDYTVSENGATVRRKGAHSEYASYYVTYYSEEAYDAWIKANGSNYSDETALSMLSDVRDALKKYDDPYLQYVESFIESQKYADKYDTLVGTVVSNKIQELADELTKNYTFDWEKAEAIEKYFHSGEFTYDITYVAEDKSVEYFLFESKTGTCSDFATAYCLLARAAGLTVRYVEGFLPEQEVSGYYFITDKCSHAYPEVFIQNYGWKVFEPTIAAEGEDNAFDFVEWLRQFRVDYGLLGVIIAFALVLIFLGGFLRIAIPLVLELIFRVRIRIVNQKKMLILCYRRMIRKASRKKKFKMLLKESDIKLEGLTPKEFCEICRQANVDLSEFDTIFEKAIYKGSELSKKERRIIIRTYEKF